MKMGKFYGIGVGPGDPKLLTLKAVELLDTIDVVCAPKSEEDRESIALSIAKTAIRRNFRVIQPVFPMTKDEKVLERAWEEAAKMILSELYNSKNVAFITIGDPMFYSTYVHVLKALKSKNPGAEIETIPGITSLNSCFSSLGISIAEQDEKIAIIPASYGVEHLKELAEKFETIILMKVSRNFEKIVAELKKEKLDKKAIFASRCGSDKFFSSTLDTELGKKIDYFSMIIVRKQL